MTLTETECIYSSCKEVNSIDSPSISYSLLPHEHLLELQEARARASTQAIYHHRQRILASSYSYYHCELLPSAFGAMIIFEYLELS